MLGTSQVVVVHCGRSVTGERRGSARWEGCFPPRIWQDVCTLEPAPPSHLYIAKERVPAAAVLVGVDGRVQDVNEEAASLRGLTLEQAVGTAAQQGMPLVVTMSVNTDAAGASHELVAVVSHELRAPLTGVKGLLQTVLEYWDRFDDAERQRLLQMATENADRMGRLLSELLDLSRLEAGRLSVRREDTDLGQLIDEVVERTVQMWTDSGGDKPVIEAHTQQLPVLPLDAERIEQVFTNLIENALRYAAPPLRITAEVTDAHVTVVVADSGQGIAPEDVERIFDKFVRRDHERRSGTGLGLYIVRGLVEAHGGRVWATSVVGQGSQFHVMLPRP
jgi:signal transduction histidine kinase